MKADSLFVLEKCNALPDDSQPYTSYSYATESGASISLEDAAIFSSEAEANKGRNTYVIRDGGFRVTTLAKAIRHYVSYNIEANEYHNGGE